MDDLSVAVVIPCYKVKKHILGVIENIGPEVDRIYVVDDKCPEETGSYVESVCKDSRVSVLYNKVNEGVGGAVIRGYKRALDDKISIIIKIDGDGQMDTSLIGNFIKPIIDGRADYTKGNRFFDPSLLEGMPIIRLIGNAFLSFFSKISSGYWNIMDPTNGFTAINSKILGLLPLDKLDKRYFFESDMLFRLGTISACVFDIPIYSRYADEKSNLNILRTILRFPFLHFGRFLKRIFYRYFLRDFNIGSLSLIFGILLFFGGMIYGAFQWFFSVYSGLPATSGTVMLSALPMFLGFQLLLFFLNFDISVVPNKCISVLLDS